MRCPVCNKQVGVQRERDPWYTDMYHLVVALHFGPNRKPCSGSGQKGK